jgi:hypothetical protein
VAVAFPELLGNAVEARQQFVDSQEGRAVGFGWRYNPRVLIIRSQRPQDAVQLGNDSQIGSALPPTEPHSL